MLISKNRAYFDLFVEFAHIFQLFRIWVVLEMSYNKPCYGQTLTLSHVLSLAVIKIV